MLKDMSGPIAFFCSRFVLALPLKETRPTLSVGRAQGKRMSPKCVQMGEKSEIASDFSTSSDFASILSASERFFHLAEVGEKSPPPFASRWTNFRELEKRKRPTKGQQETKKMTSITLSFRFPELFDLRARQRGKAAAASCPRRLPQAPPVAAAAAVGVVDVVVFAYVALYAASEASSVSLKSGERRSQTVKAAEMGVISVERGETSPSHHLVHHKRGPLAAGRL